FLVLSKNLCMMLQSSEQFVMEDRNPIAVTVNDNNGVNATDRSTESPVDMAAQMKNFPATTGLAYVFEEYVQPCLMEGFGVWLFVFIGTLAVGNMFAICVAVAHGFVIALLVAGFGNI
ncbi:unnamed protein product, partial [Owenia fusiformis]